MIGRARLTTVVTAVRPLRCCLGGSLNRRCEPPRLVGDLQGWVAGLGEGGVLAVVRGLKLDGWDVSAGFEQSALVEPVDVLEGGDLDLLDGPPGSALAAVVATWVYRVPPSRTATR